MLVLRVAWQPSPRPLGSLCSPLGPLQLRAPHREEEDSHHPGKDIFIDVYQPLLLLLLLLLLFIIRIIINIQYCIYTHPVTRTPFYIPLILAAYI